MVSGDLATSTVYAAGCVCAAAAGAFLAAQSGINSTLGSVAGRSFASVVSFAVGLAALVVFFLVDVYGLRNKGPDRHSITAAPWWSWTGGFLGAWYVAVVIIFARTLGAATLMAIFVTAQLSTAVALDSLGWVGFRRRPLHWARVVGLLLMVCGVALVTYFDGSSARRGGRAAPASAAVTVTSNGTLPETDRDPLLHDMPGSGGAGALPPANGNPEALGGTGGPDSAAERGETRRLLGGGGSGSSGGGGGGGGDVEMQGLEPRREPAGSGMRIGDVTPSPRLKAGA